MTRTSWWLLGLLMLAPGCAGLDADFSLWDESAPKGRPNHLGVIWKDGVDVQLDPNQGGRPVPGFAGRLIFMRQKPNKPGDTLAVDGTVTIEMYDDTNPNAPPLARETWTIQPEHLAHLVSKDTTGWGYPIWIPWNTFDPSVRVIRLVTRFAAKDGTTLVSEPNIIKIVDSRRGGLPPPQLSVMSTTTPGWMK
jgi:hypothetical protein